MNRKPSFFAELKQRHVVRAGIIYAAAVWAIAQGIAQLGPTFGVSTMVTWWFVIACAIGFPFWIAFAWYFKFTAGGIEREGEAVEDQAAIRRTGRRLDYWIIGILVIAVVLLLTNQLVLQRGKTLREFTTGPTAVTSVFNPPNDSIVVLPFQNLGAAKQQYFSDGITEELTGALGEDTGLTVIAWETASRYADTKQTPEEIGKALNVAHTLVGSIERAGDEVRVSVELVSTVTGRQLWAAHYDGTLRNIFAMQDKITGAIADTLKVRFAGMQAAPTLNPQAHELYLKGFAALDRFTAKDARAALNYFHNALKLDPNYADAWAGLASAYGMLSQVSTLPTSEAIRKMRPADEKALTLDPRNINALIGLASADNFVGNLAKSKAEYGRALALDPSDAKAHLDYGNLLPLRPGLVQYQEAARLDPDDAVTQNNLAVDYQDLGDWARMAAASRALLKLSPHYIFSAFYLAFAYEQMHRGKDAVKAFDLVRPATTQDKQLLDAGRLTYQAQIKPSLRPKALAALNRLRRARLDPVSQGALIQLYLALGGKGAAMQMLPGTCVAVPVGCNDLAINPVYRSLHGNPRFEKLAKQYTTITLGATLASAPSPASSR